MNILLWVLQIALAWLCIAGGYFQIFKFEDLKKGVAAMRATPKALWTVLGIVGIVAGIGLLLPPPLACCPNQIAIAAVIVAIHSAFISGLYLFYGDRSPVMFTLVMTVIAAFIAYGRFVLAPFVVA